jgi:hypothetical protein
MRLGVLVGAALFLASAHASADDTVVVYPPGQGPQAEAQPSQPSARVRMRFRAYKARPARVYAEISSDKWALVCSTPCAADLFPGTHLRAVYDSHDDEPHDFTAEGTAGTPMDVEIRPASKGPLAGGIVMTSIGGLTALVGLILLAVSTSSAIPDHQAIGTAGTVCTAVGLGLTIGGVLIIANRSQEPRIRQEPSLRYDEAPRQTWLAPKVVPTPLGLSLSF